MIIEAYDRLEDVRRLFEEYAAWLGISLDFQDFAVELASLPGKYARPDGRLYLALIDGEAAGCIALRHFDTNPDGSRRCEMKRLFVRDRFRGHGLGELLAKQIIEDAREIDYTEMLLDSFTHMDKAIALYKRLGFTESQPYRYNPHPDVIYLQLNL